MQGVLFTPVLMETTMFYKLQVQDHIRVSPRLLGGDVLKSVMTAIRSKYEGFIDDELGVVIDVAEVKNVGEGVIIPGDGASYFESVFELVSFRPELQEVVSGRIRDIADFGAFMSLGPLDGMIHISQTMDDFVSFAKDKVLQGRDGKRSLKIGDACRARIIAVSFKDVTNPKIGLTMRQPGLGKVEWLLPEDESTAKPEVKKEEKKKEKK